MVVSDMELDDGPREPGDAVQDSSKYDFISSCLLIAHSHSHAELLKNDVKIVAFEPS